MIMGKDQLMDLSLDPVASPPQTIPFTQPRQNALVWKHDGGIMYCGGGQGETNCQYWPIGATAAQSAPSLPAAFWLGGSALLAPDVLWLGAGRLASGGSTLENKHYLHTVAGYTRLPNLPFNLVCFCAISLGGNR